MTSPIVGPHPSSMPPAHRAMPDRERGLAPQLDVAAVIRSGGIRAVFQPIVELESRGVLAYEALTRGPVDSPLERPQFLFAAARAQGLLTDLDWHCRGVAMRAALEADLGPDIALFLNIEPATLGASIPDPLVPLLDEAQRRFRVVVEFTERALTARPAELLRAVHRVREMGWGVALDDVGAEPAALALMPFMRPDVIKLDRRLVQDGVTGVAASKLGAVIAEAERTGALVLAEGIETEAQFRTSLARGASLGQGWLFGTPERLPSVVERPVVPMALLPADPADMSMTPVSLVFPRRKPRRASKVDLVWISSELERWLRTLRPRRSCSPRSRTWSGSPPPARAGTPTSRCAIRSWR